MGLRLAGEGGNVFTLVDLSVCFSVCLWSSLLKEVWTDFHETCWRYVGHGVVGHGLGTNR